MSVAVDDGSVELLLPESWSTEPTSFYIQGEIQSTDWWMCPICYTDCPPQMQSMACGHEFCNKCMHNISTTISLDRCPLCRMSGDAVSVDSARRASTNLHRFFSERAVFDCDLCHRVAIPVRDFRTHRDTVCDGTRCVCGAENMTRRDLQIHVGTCDQALLELVDKQHEELRDLLHVPDHVVGILRALVLQQQASIRTIRFGLTLESTPQTALPPPPPLPPPSLPPPPPPSITDSRLRRR